MSTTPEYMPVLSRGAHSGPSKGACIMEYVSFIAGEEWSDTPACTHPVLTRVAQNVNDILSDADRHLLLPLLPRLMGTSARTGDPVMSVRLAVWAARQVAHLNADTRVMAAIEAAEAWIESPSHAAAAAARSASSGAHAAAFRSVSVEVSSARAAAYAAHAASYAPAAAYAIDVAAHAAARVDNNADAVARVKFLADLITEYDRLTGRAEHPTVTEGDLRRCAELTA